MVPAQPCHTVLPGTARSVTAMRGWGQNMRDHISSVAGLNALMPCTPWGVCLIPVMQWLLLFNSSGDHVLNVRHADLGSSLHMALHECEAACKLQGHMMPHTKNVEL